MCSVIQSYRLKHELKLLWSTLVCVHEEFILQGCVCVPFISCVCMPNIGWWCRRTSLTFSKKLLLHLLAFNNGNLWNYLLKLGLCCTQLIQLNPPRQVFVRLDHIFHAPSCTGVSLGLIHPSHTGSNLLTLWVTLLDSHSQIVHSEINADEVKTTEQIRSC